MHYRVMQSLYFSAFRRIVSVHRTAPCSRVLALRYCRNDPRVTPQWVPSTQSEAEIKLDFSQLDPDKFGTLSKKPTDINQVVEKMPEEQEDKEEYVIRDKENKKKRRPMKFYYHLIQDLLQDKKVYFIGHPTLFYEI